MLVILAVQALLISWLAMVYSPNIDEVGHLGAGVYVWRTGRNSVYRVNPPLVRAIFALPLHAASPAVPISDVSNGTGIRHEWRLGEEVVHGEPRWPWLVVLGRWLLLPFTIVTSIVIYRWAVQLFGRKSGVLAVILWCFSPEALTWASQATPDMASACIAIIVWYATWKWAQSGEWSHAIIVAVGLGIALLTRTMFVFYWVAIPVAVLGYRVLARQEIWCRQWIIQSTCLLLVSLFVLGLKPGLFIARFDKKTYTVLKLFVVCNLYQHR